MPCSRTPCDLVDAIARLYQDRAGIPGPEEFPELKPKLDDYRFPLELFDASELRASIEPERVSAIRRAVQHVGTPQGEITVQYYAPWHDRSVIRRDSVDAAFSQAVMEHVEDINAAYRALSGWMRDDGYMSHQIDFRSHGLATCWNGHWSYSDWLFRIAKGRRPYLLNRQPKSAHLRAIREAGFEILSESPVQGDPGITRAALAPRFRGLSDDDLSTSGVFLVARKPPAASAR